MVHTHPHAIMYYFTKEIEYKYSIHPLSIPILCFGKHLKNKNPKTNWLGLRSIFKLFHLSVLSKTENLS